MVLPLQVDVVICVLAVQYCLEVYMQRNESREQTQCSGPLNAVLVMSLVVCY